MLLPPCVENYVPEHHLARLVVETVDQLDLSCILDGYNADGMGGAAIDPKAILATLIYAYAHAITSSRDIETLCRENMVFRFLNCNQMPDHTTFARFRKRHSAAFTELFAQVLDHCRLAGLGKAGTIALDGTKLKGNAAMDQNRTLKKISEELARDAEAKDLAEDFRYGRGKQKNELPKGLRHKEDRRKRLLEAKRLIEEKQSQEAQAHQAKIETRVQEEQETGRKKRGRKPKEPRTEADAEPKANVTDPESRTLKTRSGYAQGYNAQAVVSMDQLILAADITPEANDVKQLIPMIRPAQANVARTAAAGVVAEIEKILADAGYHSRANLLDLEQTGVEGFIPSTKSWKLRKAVMAAGYYEGPIPEDLDPVMRMELKLRTDVGHQIYKLRGQTIEPTFGQTKDGLAGLPRRGIEAARADWRMICLAHNLKKLWRHNQASRKAA
jgi:transposase